MSQDAPDPQEPPHAVGDLIAEKYRVERVLGAGGMGKVVSVVHTGLRERRAIKFMLARHLDDAEAVQRFLREARAAARLRSEHVCKVHDVGRLPNGAPYMVMEHLKGSDLGAELERRGVLPLEEAVLYMLQAGEALSEAHAAGIVHRDLKPENLFLAKQADGTRMVKVLDFGISKVDAASPGELRMTRTTAIMGSPYYMSPEQSRATRDVDARADIWSLGVLFYQLVTGRLPFLGSNLTEIITSVMFADFLPASTIVPALPKKIDHVIRRCLERDLSRRYASVAELAADLTPFAPPDGRRSADRISRTTPRTSGAFRVEDSVSLDPVSSDRASKTAAAPGRPRFNRALLLSAGGALALVGASTAFLVHNWSRGPAPAASASSALPVESIAVPVASVTAPAASVTAAAASITVPATAAPAATVEPVVVPSAMAAATAPSVSASPPGGRPLLGKGPLVRPGASASPLPPPPGASDPFGAGRQ